MAMCSNFLNLETLLCEIKSKNTKEKRMNFCCIIPKIQKKEIVSGLLRVRIKRGVNLAIRDINTSDPYIVIRMGKQKLKTRVMERHVNPVWNEDLTLFIYNPELPVKLAVLDHDFFTTDDKMGDAEFSIQPFLEGLKTRNLKNLPSGTVINRIKPSKFNCLAEESCITWRNSAVVQDMCLRLRNVECGEVELELHWINVPGCKLV